LWDETAGDIEVIWVRGEAKFFCKGGWTGFSDLPVGSNRIERLQEIAVLPQKPITFEASPLAACVHEQPVACVSSRLRRDLPRHQSDLAACDEAKVGQLHSMIERYGILAMSSPHGEFKPF
jgi:hypothetical protein